MTMHTADASFWDRIAPSYSAQPIANPEAWQRKLAVHKALLRPQDTVLDVGCGTGSLCLELAPHAQRVHGVDFSAAMVAIARAKATADGAANVAFSQGTVDDLDAQHDVVSAYSLLHLVPDLDEALARLFAATRPGGWFVSSTTTLGDGWIPYRPILAVMRWLGKAPSVLILRRAHLLARIAAAGFVDVRLTEVGADSTIAYVVARRPEAAPAR
jgi:ubiquinone/menaquinone biosynthesis C-methylase UbiE